MTDHAILPTYIGKEEADPMAQYPPKISRTASTKQLRARGITRLTVDIPSSFREEASDGPDSQRKSSSHWGTSEFKLYYAVVAIALLVMIWIPVSLSQRASRVLPFAHVVNVLYSITQKLQSVPTQTIARLALRSRRCTSLRATGSFFDRL